MVVPNLFAQSSLSKQLNYANDLFEQQKYFDAVTEFKRLLFFDKIGKYDYDANYKIGLSYKEGAIFDKALKHFEGALKSSRTNLEAFRSQNQIARVKILQKKTSEALNILNNMEENPEYSDFTEKIKYWKGWAYMFADDWDKAYQIFFELPKHSELADLTKKTADEKYSVLFSKVISYILPGSGQIYTGNYLSGLLSLGWNGLWGYLTINSFIEKRIFDGLAIGNLLWLRFYRGNIQNAGKFAKQENIKIANKTLKYLQNNFQGKKP
jgi:tetratricopeptide (TPR) repeat protein